MMTVRPHHHDDKCKCYQESQEVHTLRYDEESNIIIRLQLIKSLLNNKKYNERETQIMVAGLRLENFRSR